MRVYKSKSALKTAISRNRQLAAIDFSVLEFEEVFTAIFVVLNDLEKKIVQKERFNYKEF